VLVEAAINVIPKCPELVESQEELAGSNPMLYTADVAAAVAACAG
jgi:hypothetical protein